MDMRLTLAAALALTGFGRIAAAADNTEKLKEKEEARLERKCEKEDAKERRDEDRGRKHLAPDNKWDELCVPPAPPPDPENPPAEPPPPIMPVPPM